MKRALVFLAVIFAVALAIRMTPFFWENRPIGLDSYYHMRMAAGFVDGLPVYDSLSYGGRPYEYPPGIHVLLSFMPEAAPIIITLIGAMAVLSVFLLAREIYNEKVALVASFLIAFMPVHIWKTSSNVLVTAVDMTLLILACYFLARKDTAKYFSISLLIFMFSPAISVLSLLLYIPSMRKDSKSILVVAAIIIEASAAYLLYGSAISIYAGTLPYDISSALFENIGVADVLYRLTPFLIPLSVLGLYMSRKNASRPVLLWLAVILVLFVAGKIETDRGLAYMAVPMSVLSAHAIASIKRKEIVVIILAATAITGIYSLNSLRWGIVTDDEYSALTWIKENTPKDSVILAQFLEGHWVSGIAERKNIADPNLIGAPAAERLEDILSAYRNQSQKEILSRYSVSYILYTERAPQVGARPEYFPYKEVFRSGNVRVFEVTSSSSPREAR
ncbi:MAG: hypothetical protein HYW27_04420 [Candidatus Aenigmarchaeota archaeon]|nr:hypothetical protein [Candidatus Aenigmarchaeota archaeon]